MREEVTTRGENSSLLFRAAGGRRAGMEGGGQRGR